MRKLLYFVTWLALLLGYSPLSQGQIINTIAGNGTGTFSGDGVATTNSLRNPTTCVVDLAGNVYIADWGNHRIRKVTPAGIMTTIAGTGTPGHTGDGSAATTATLNQPNGMGIDLAGNLYVAEQGNNDVRKISTTGIITTVAGTGGPGYSGDGAAATSATMRTTSGVAIDASGVIYIADWGNNVIRKVDASGIMSTIAGNGTAGYGGDGGPATAAICKLNHPYSVSLDLLGNLYISDENNNRLRAINLSTGIISLVAGTGSAGSSGDGGPATAATFNLPDGIVATAGDIYIADASNNKIRKVHLATGIVTTIAGTGSVGSSGDGSPATIATLHTPSGVELDAAGNVYISDFNNHKIRMITNGNHLPRFDSGRTQRFNICENSVDSINALLAVMDTDAGQPLTWSLYTAPLHGTIYSAGSAVSVGGTLYTTTSTGGHVVPVGLHYQPAVGYTSRDSFVIRVNDGISVDSTEVYVNITPLPNPSAISGPSSVCVGSTITLSDDSTGGAWSASNGHATVGSTGIVTGVTAGLDTIKYTLTNTCGATEVTKVISVNALPGAITPSGPVTVCVGGTVTLSDPTSGGSWSASNGTATVIGGVVSGVSAGVDTIFYSVAGCSVSKAVTVNAAVAPVSPSGSMVCTGNTILLTDATSSGTWTASNGHATITSGGIVTGVSGGVDTITYTVAGCFATATVTVAAITAITPISSSLCVGGTVTLTDGGTLGVWSASNGHATVGSGSGLVTAVSAGIDTITYGIFNGSILVCSTTATVTVNTTPVAIAPPTPVSICLGTTAGLSDATSGGVWSTSSGSIATVGSTGIVTGVGVGTATISYTIGSCFAIKNVTVISTPAPISPASLTLCQGASTTLSDGSPGGSWTSSNSLIATIGSTSGSLTGVGVGPVNITYTVGTCFVTSTATIAVMPASIAPSGPVSVCTGASTTLTDGTTGGAWTSGNTSIATVGSSGSVTGVSSGVVLISYTIGSCSATKSITVISTPSAISPSPVFACTGGTTLVTDGTPGGNWTSGNTSVATITSGGVVSGVAVGSTNITYTIGTCFVTAPVTVNATPSSITPSGTLSICPGTVVLMGDATAGGTWSSSATSIATIGSSSGSLSAISTGVATISYTVSGCSAIKFVTVTGTPASIVPAAPAICLGNTITFTDASPGGVWSSSSTSVATIGSGSGSVTTVSAGVTTITYTIGLCFVTTPLTVNSNPSAINPSGPISVCVGGTAALSDPSPGGTWSSSASGVASVGSVSGLVTGISSGVANISYTNASGCSSLKAVTVSTTPIAIAPVSSTVCTGSTETLSNAVGGGVWTSGNTAIATIGSSSGLVSGVAAGNTTITYSIGSCTTTATVTVGPLPSVASIVGPSNVCTGSTISLTDATSGGVWSSSSTSIATVGTGGVVTGVGAGIANISYTVTNSCGSIAATHTVNVVAPGVAPITGLSLMCAGTFTTYTDATAGGIWTASNAHATISGSGLVTGVSAGTDTITYTVTNVCGTSATTKVLTVGPYLTAGTIFGAGSLCAGATIALSDLAPSGTWSASNGSATVGSTGVVTGISGGVDTIMYTVTSSCGSAVATHPVTVTALPDAGTITGPSTICAGMVVPYTDAATGGTWSLTNTRATISGSGIVTAISTGADTIRYTVVNSCGTAIATKIITIGPFLTAGAISGPGSVCAGASITLADPAPGGVWSVSNSSASVAGGTVTGVTGGVDTVLYTVTSACGSVAASKSITINALPDAGTISGPSSVCAGSVTLYSDAAPGGIWTVTNAHALITGGGSLTALSAGTDTIVYTVTNTCGTASSAKIVAIGSAFSASPVTGPSGVCIGSAILLTDATPGGTWTSSATAIATVGSSTGVVSGISSGVATVTYTVAGSCGTATATASVTVSPTPVAGAISGSSALCVGTSSLYTDAAPGGIWSVTNGHASITSGGLATALSAGIDTMVYTVANSCGTATAMLPVAILSSPGAGTITGPSTVCTGSSVILLDGVPGGIWSASNGSATVGSTGIVTGVSAGLDTVMYTVASSCGTATATYLVAVLSGAGAAPISGPGVVCMGSIITLTEATPGGVWGASNGHATITTSGLVTGITPGVDTMTYTVSSSCGTSSAIKVITVNTLPTTGTISGPSMVCVGAATLLTSSGSGGVWTVTNSNASVGSSTGIVIGVAAGVDTVVYTATTACGTVATTASITVNPLPDAGFITGSDSLCIGSSIILSDGVVGGVWSAGNTNASVVSGVVSGISAGTDPVSYTVTNSCGSASAVKIVVIAAPPVSGTITGPSAVCVGSGITLIDAAPGGAWLASNGTAAVVAPGIIHGVSVGVDTIFYVVINVCGYSSAYKIVNVNPVPFVAPVSGATTQCVGSVNTLSDAVGGGVWLSGNPSVATVGVSTGDVTGVAAGIADITYTVTNGFGCPTSVTIVDTVVSVPVIPAITGSATACVGAATTLLDAATGGVWTSSNTSVATIGSTSGVLTGVSAGTVTITYTVNNLCGSMFVTTTETVNAPPFVAPISGITHQCEGASSSLADATPGGIWTSSNTTVATAGSATGIVAGVTAGVTTINYAFTSTAGCTSVVSVSDTVVAAPIVAAITGIASECIGTATALSDATPGGVWTSSDVSVATVASGVVTGVAAGTVAINYSVTNLSGCTTTVSITDTVNDVPVVAPVSGVMNVCIGFTTALSDVTPGGAWSAANANATVASGVVTGVAVGIDTITYTVTNGCGSASALAIVTIDPAPSAGLITGPADLCAGTTIALLATAPGGVWASANAHASVGPTGLLVGVTPGVDTITYSVTNACGTATTILVVTVSTVPATAGAITGPSSVCKGSTITLVDPVTGGIWTATNTRAAVSVSGVVTGVNAGVDTIVYTVSNSCGSVSAIKVISVSQPPSAGVISGASDVCIGGSAALATSGGTPGGSWSSSNTAVAGVSSGGVVSGIAAGSATISYTVTNSCGSRSATHGINVLTHEQCRTVVGTQNGAGDVRIYPNPASELLYIDAPVRVGITVMSVDGKIVIDQDDVTSVDVTRLTPGLYLVRIRDDQSLLIKTAKFVKE